MNYTEGDIVRVVKWKPDDIDYDRLMHRVGIVVDSGLRRSEFVDVRIPGEGMFLFYPDELEKIDG